MNVQSCESLTPRQEFGEALSAISGLPKMRDVCFDLGDHEDEYRLQLTGEIVTMVKKSTLPLRESRETKLNPFVL